MYGIELIVVVADVVSWLSDDMKGVYKNVRFGDYTGDESWLPIATTVYVNLALVHQSQLPTKRQTAETIYLLTKGKNCEVYKKLKLQ